MTEIKNIGLELAVIGSAISIIGVLLNNLFLDHHSAMVVWVFSNAILMVYFLGHSQDWWDGAISSEVICLMYVVMLVSGVIGLVRM